MSFTHMTRVRLLAPHATTRGVCATKVSPLRKTSQTVVHPRGFASVSTSTTAIPHHGHKAIVVGGGAAGLAISHRLLRSRRFRPQDIAIVDPASHHDYQPGWTLVGGGLKSNQQLRRHLPALIDPKIKFYNEGVRNFSPCDNEITLGDSGRKLAYDHLVVVPGIHIDYTSIKGLPEALADPRSLVSSTYGYDTCSKVFGTVQKLERGDAIFTQPSGVVKCAGAPQKMMWMALDYWKRANRYNYSGDSAIRITFATGLPVMFGVPKYNAKLEQLQRQRGVEALFQHDLVAIDDGNKATFACSESGEQVTRRFDFLHAVPKMGPHAFMKESPLSDKAGFVDVDQWTTRHKTYHNVWSVGDASSLPTSKTAAAITAQVPVLVQNLLLSLDKKEPAAKYDGYTSCPLITEYSRAYLGSIKESLSAHFPC
ncbi:hypothetical protein ACHAQA_009542 [Verticillium albo-atrum]